MMAHFSPDLKAELSREAIIFRSNETVPTCSESSASDLFTKINSSVVRTEYSGLFSIMGITLFWFSVVAFPASKNGRFHGQRPRSNKTKMRCAIQGDRPCDWLAPNTRYVCPLFRPLAAFP